jgi:hypothetical protein
VFGLLANERGGLPQANDFGDDASAFSLRDPRAGGA